MSFGGAEGDFRDHILRRPCSVDVVLILLEDVILIIKLFPEPIGTIAVDTDTDVGCQRPVATASSTRKAKSKSGSPWSN
jgi:hypothetical protein